METTIDLLEQRVSLLLGRFAALRAEVVRLEDEIAQAAAREEPTPPSVPPPGDDARGRLAAENARLLEERAAVRERVRDLIRDIDRSLAGAP